MAGAEALGVSKTAQNSIFVSSGFSGAFACPAAKLNFVEFSYGTRKISIVVIDVTLTSLCGDGALSRPTIENGML